MKAISFSFITSQKKFHNHPHNVLSHKEWDVLVPIWPTGLSVLQHIMSDVVSKPWLIFCSTATSSTVVSWFSCIFCSTLMCQCQRDSQSDWLKQAALAKFYSSTFNLPVLLINLLKQHIFPPKMPLLSVMNLLRFLTLTTQEMNNFALFLSCICF